MSLFENILIVVISALFLPASIVALFYNYGALILCPQDGLRHHVQRSARFRPRKIVITGVSTPSGLRVARALYTTGHIIVGIEEGRYSFLNHARWSRVVSRLRMISVPSNSNSGDAYAERLFSLIVKERANLWIDCSNGKSPRALARTKELVEQRSTCLCLVPSSEHIQQFESRSGFQQLAQQLGLPSPESFSVGSRGDIYKILNGSDGKTFMLSSPNGTSEPSMRTLLPRRTVSQTYHDVAQLKLSKSSPWRLEQYTEGFPRFAACGVIVQGKLKAFAASAVSGKMVCQSLPTKSGLSEAMKQYMQDFASAVGPSLSSHLTMEFGLDEKATHAGVVQQILPVNGRLLPHESILLFDGKRGAIDLTRAYLEMLSTTTTELEVYTGLPYADTTSNPIVPAEPEIGVYSVHHDLRVLVVEPLINLIALRSSISTVARSWVVFLQHVVAWQEALYEFGDPTPLFWYTHVSTPVDLVSNTMREAWSRLSHVVHKGSFRRRRDRRAIQNGK